MPVEQVQPSLVARTLCPVAARVQQTLGTGIGNKLRRDGTSPLNVVYLDSNSKPRMPGTERRGTKSRTFAYPTPPAVAQSSHPNEIAR